jgi:hypothetical protein
VIVRIDSTKISDHWEAIKPTIAAAFSSSSVDITEAEFNNILQQLIAGNMQCWMAFREKEPRILMITTFILDPRGIKSLLIYSVSAYMPNTDAEWLEVYEYMKEWGKKNNCVNIVAFTQNNRILDIARKFGATIDNFVTFKI